MYTKKQGVRYTLDCTSSGLISMAWSSGVGNEMLAPNKGRIISLLATQMLASQHWLCRIELVGRYIVLLREVFLRKCPPACYSCHSDELHPTPLLSRFPRTRSNRLPVATPLFYDDKYRIGI